MLENARAYAVITVYSAYRLDNESKKWHLVRMDTGSSPKLELREIYFLSSHIMRVFRGVTSAIPCHKHGFIRAPHATERHGMRVTFLSA